MYNHYRWSEEEYEEEPKAIESECIADSVYAIIEHLFDSANAIDEEQITGHFAYLCEKLGIDKGLLKSGLCVIHRKERQPDKSIEVIESIRGPAKVLKEELYNRERPVDVKRLDEAVSRICWLSSQSVPYGEHVTVCRSRALNPSPYNHIFG